MMKKTCLLDLITAAALTLGLFVISLQASAAVVCVGTGAVATSCGGVVINSTTYNVTWALPNYTSAGTTIFNAVSADAAAAADTINMALNTGLFTNIEYDTGTGTSSAFACSEACYYVPYRINDTNVDTWESRYLGNPDNTWYRDPTNLGNLHYAFDIQNLRPVTVFTPAAVPVPAALPLFLSGTVLVGWLGRRRRQGC